MIKKRPAKKSSTKKTADKRGSRYRDKSAGKPAFRTADDDGTQRLNKVLAAAGLGSRREVESLIVDGRVEIDREVVTDLACKVNPLAVTIKVDGQTLKKFRPVYFALNKPKGVLSTNKDPSGRIRVIDLVPDTQRVFSVGRLDRNSEGLTLLTNDGELAQRLAHPKFRVQKTYFVVVAGLLNESELDKLRRGVHLAEGFARIDGAAIKKHRKGCTEVEIVLSEGKNREIRRILARAGHKVVVLRRIAIGPLRLGLLPVGASRVLTSAEVNELYAITDTSTRPKKATKKAAKRRKSGDAESTVIDADGKTKGPAQGKAAGPSKSKGGKHASSHSSIGDEDIEDDDDDGFPYMDDDFTSDGEAFPAFDEDYDGEFDVGSPEGSVLSYDEDVDEVGEISGETEPARTPRGRGGASGRGNASGRAKETGRRKINRKSMAEEADAAGERSYTRPRSGSIRSKAAGAKRAAAAGRGPKSRGAKTSAGGSSGRGKVAVTKRSDSRSSAPRGASKTEASGKKSAPKSARTKTRSGSAGASRGPVANAKRGRGKGKGR